MLNGFSKKGIAVLLALAFLSSPSLASSKNVPGLKELKAFMKEQLNQMKTQYGFEKNELFNNAKSQLQSQTGNYGMGKINNTLSDLKARQYSPDSWKEALKVQSGGVNDRYRELVKDYEKNHPDVKESNHVSGLNTNKDDEVLVKSFQQGRAVNRAVSVQATYAYDNINTHLKNIHALSEKIDKTDNVKAATDLNARIMAEVGYLQAEQIKLQALQNQQLSQGMAKALDDERLSILYARDDSLSVPK